MEKYLVSVYLPAAGKHLDVFLPGGKRIAEVIRLLVTVAETLTGGSYRGTTDAMLLNAESGIPYPLTHTVEEVGIRNATALILI